MIVDCHAHLVPPDLLDAIRKDKARFPSVRQIEDGGSLAFAFAGAKPTRPVSKPLADIPARLAWLKNKASTSRWSAAGSTCSAMSYKAMKAKLGAG